MKCLTFSDSKVWLELIGVRIDENRCPLFDRKVDATMATLPTDVSALYYLCIGIVDRFPKGPNSLLWLSSWETYPPEQIALFETIRRGNGETRSLIDAPGHLFGGDSLQERTMMIGLIFLILAFNWEGYLISSIETYSHFGDQYIVFADSNVANSQVYKRLLDQFGLRKIRDVREAWNIAPKKR